MRGVLTTMAGLFLIGATATVGKPADSETSKSEQTLEKGLNAVALNASPNADAQNKVNSQGAEHASQNAILKVCTKDTPAAQRAAICKIRQPRLIRANAPARSSMRSSGSSRPTWRRTRFGAGGCETVRTGSMGSARLS